MRVFVAGATGVLGRRIVRQLVRRGHSVFGLARSDAAEKTVRSSGGEPRRADLFDADALAKAAVDCDVVIRAATSIPTRLRPTSRDWAMNDRIRTEGTRALTAATVQIGARAYIQEGVVWAVRGPEGKPFDEDAPPVTVPILASSLEAERIANEAAGRHGFRSATLRCGAFYSADGWHTRILGESLVRGRPVLIGSNDPVWSLIDVDDAASAFVAATEAPKSGVWHIVDDRPASRAEFLVALARSIGARPPRRLPRWLARVVVGRYLTELLTSSFVTSNARFRRDFAWRPSYPTYEEGLAEIAATWQSEGFPPRRT